MGEHEERPTLPCPQCGKGLVPASGRGRYDANDNEVWHRNTCRCRWCEWWWSNDGTLYTCECGCVAKVNTEDEHAYCSEVPR